MATKIYDPRNGTAAGKKKKKSHNADELMP